MIKEEEKNTNLILKIDKDIKDRFLKVAKNNEETGSSLIRKFIKEYLKEHSQTTMTFK